MEKKLIILKGVENSGKTTTLVEFYKGLENNITGHIEKYELVDKDKDFFVIFKIKNNKGQEITVAILSCSIIEAIQCHLKKFNEWIKKILNTNCDYVFLCFKSKLVKHKEEVHKVIKDFESKGFELEEIRTKKIGEEKEQIKEKTINVKLMRKKLHI